MDLGLFTEASTFALWAKAERGPLPLAAIEPMLDSLQQQLKQVATCSTLVAQVLIDVHRSSGHVAQAQKLTDEIIAFALAHDEKVYLPERLRIRGQQLESSDPALAACDYREAIELARFDERPQPGAACGREPRSARGPRAIGGMKEAEFSRISAATEAGLAASHPPRLVRKIETE